MNTRVLLAALMASLVFSVYSPVRADVKLPSVFGSNMVLQRDMPVPIWGWAEPGEEVTVRFGSTKKTVKASMTFNTAVLPVPPGPMIAN